MIVVFIIFIILSCGSATTAFKGRIGSTAVMSIVLGYLSSLFVVFTFTYMFMGEANLLGLVVLFGIPISAITISVAKKKLNE